MHPICLMCRNCQEAWHLWEEQPKHWMRPIIGSEVWKVLIALLVCNVLLWPGTSLLSCQQALGLCSS